LAGSGHRRPVGLLRGLRGIRVGLVPWIFRAADKSDAASLKPAIHIGAPHNRPHRAHNPLGNQFILILILILILTGRRAAGPTAAFFPVRAFQNLAAPPCHVPRVAAITIAC
jgi:hypothetical protein